MTIGIISGPVDIGGVAAVIRVAASESEAGAGPGCGVWVFKNFKVFL